MTSLKHVGKFGEDKPCIILYREVPDEPQNCLIVETTGLEDMKHDALMRVVQSAEAQEANELSEVLKRNNFNDGSIMLDDLHYTKKIKKVSVDMVSLTPSLGQSVPLSLVNEELRKISGGHVEPVTSDTHLNEPIVNDNSSEDPVKSATEVAANLKHQADLMLDDARLMQAEAETKLAEAIKLDPSLADASS